jgi:lysophospholipase L1-like esterase
MTVRHLLLSALLAVACGMHPPAHENHARYLALGDSYTIGESVSPRERFPVQLAERLQLGEPQIIARTGWTVDELNDAIDAAPPQGRFELVTLLIGVNDQFRGGTVEAYRPRFNAMLQRAIKFAGGDPKRVVVVSIPDWGATPFAEGNDRAAIGAAIDRFNAINRQETERAGARYADITAISRRARDDRSLIAADGLHPSATMYAAWVAVIERALLSHPR